MGVFVKAHTLLHAIYHDHLDHLKMNKNDKI